MWSATPKSTIRPAKRSTRADQYPGAGASACNPAALLAGAWVDLAERLPEAERAVAERQLRTHFKAAPLEIEQNCNPIGHLRALSRDPMAGCRLSPIRQCSPDMLFGVGVQRR